MTNDEILKRYKNAYLMANGKASKAEYLANGWFNLSSGPTRKSDVIAATRVLEERAILRNEK